MNPGRYHSSNSFLSKMPIIQRPTPSRVKLTQVLEKRSSVKGAKWKHRFPSACFQGDTAGKKCKRGYCAGSQEILLCLVSLTRLATLGIMCLSLSATQSVPRVNRWPPRPFNSCKSQSKKNRTPL